MTTTSLDEIDAVSLDCKTQCLPAEHRALLTRLTNLLQDSSAGYVIKGRALRQVQQLRLYREHFLRFEDYCAHFVKISRGRAYQFIQAVQVYEQIEHQLGVEIKVEWQARELIGIPAYRRAELWREVLATAPPGALKGKHIKSVKSRLLAAWAALDDDPTRKHFMRVPDDEVSLAAYTWSPNTGCLADCAYCLARDLVEQRVETVVHGYVPHCYEDRLSVPRVMPTPVQADGPDGAVLVSPYGDMFGHWVPEEWIHRVLDIVRETPAWRFIFQTRFPERLRAFDWPANAWVGVTVVAQAGVMPALETMRALNASVRLLFCEPLVEALKFPTMEMFEMLVLGHLRDSHAGAGFPAPLAWVASLYNTARQGDCEVICRPHMLIEPCDANPRPR